MFRARMHRLSATATSDLLGSSTAKTSVERITWGEGFAFSAYGVRIGVQVDDSSVLELLPEYLPHGWKRSASTVVDRTYSICVARGRKGQGITEYLEGKPAARADSNELDVEVTERTPDLEQENPGVRAALYHLYRGGCGLAHTNSLYELLDAFESDLHFYVATWARRLVFVHAGVVGWQGRALLLPGPSRSGKTRLVAALVRAGAIYYSDEYAAIDELGRVHPYLKPLSIRDESGVRRKRCPVEDLGGSCGTKALPGGLIAFTRHSLDAIWKPHPLSPGRAMLGLLANTVSVRRKPEAAMTAVRWVCVEAPALEGPRGEAEDVARWLLAQAER